MQTIIQQTEQFSDPHTEKYIAEQSRKMLAMAQLLGADHNRMRRIPPSGGELSSLIRPITSFANLVLAETNKLVQSHLHQNKGAMEKAAVEIENEELELQKEKLDAEILIENRNIKASLPASALGIFIFGLALSAIFIFFETLYVADAVQIIMSTYLSSLGLAICISLGSPIIATLGRYQILRIQTLKWRRIATVLLFSFIFLIFLKVGMWRAEYLELMTGKDVSAWDFTFLAMMFFIVQWLIGRFVIVPSLAQLREAIANYLEQRKINKLINKRNNLEEKKKNNERELHNKLVSRIAVIAYAKYCENTIQYLYEKAVETYKEAYLAKHYGPAPKCFDDVLPALNFFTSDINLSVTKNTQTHESHN